MRKSGFILLMAVLLAALPAAASTFLAMSQEEMVAGSEAVVQGKVTALESFWSDSGRVILTEATVEVEEVLAGDAPPVVTVRTFGGQVGDVVIEAHGFPRFQPDERVVLFLNRDDGDDSLRVLGYQLGHYRVVKRLDGVTLAVPQVDEDVPFLTPSGKPVPAPASLRFNDFKAGIRATAESLRGGAPQR